ncbi:MAG: hypothetical protein Ct9H90mP2_07950 [Dehalococcoidia bacterium]|nr:MAG: hypothetical protein Ct9H90mP2_07950 [Dehalococcoidia bacterium]
MLADSGEDVILISEDQQYAANVEKAYLKKIYTRKNKKKTWKLLIPQT